jgi:uncharacterized protein (DUF2235 family)
MPRRLIFCFDGTWNKLSADCPTNVVLTAEMIRPTARDGTPQLVYYDEGVGTAKAERFRGGALGKGMMENLREAYRFLIFNYEPGDQIFAFGFSRGAFTARSFLGLIRHAGIVNADRASNIDRAFAIYRAAARGEGDDLPEMLQFRAECSPQVCVSDLDHDWRKARLGTEFNESTPVVDMRFLGVWDSVAALGLPKFIPFATRINRKRHSHDVKLTSKVKAARHAVAVDEQRVLFEPVLWNNVAELNAAQGQSRFDHDAPYQQKWFPGVHSSVGGGGDNTGLAHGALLWVLQGARNAGLDVRDQSDAVTFRIAPQPLGPLAASNNPPWHDRGPVGAAKRLFLNAPRVGPNDIVDVSASVRRRWYAPADAMADGAYRPVTLAAIGTMLDQQRPPPLATGVDGVKGDIHIVVARETLGKIAKIRYGDPKRWAEIFEANRDVIDDPNAISPGDQLRIPGLPLSGADGP